ncbi:hypothetical protein CPJCM30710_11550 [Clostridium polyendosporum]|uniref:Uncharacterized protein n=1 Tax=Clostridium polyendosporum TaxID=69208 RepID=A0A919RZ74_9CLOT|nr:hypothetical protein CPJCM30710_11550 [Clostridium polyendosporum]
MGRLVVNEEETIKEVYFQKIFEINLIAYMMQKTENNVKIKIINNEV